LGWCERLPKGKGFISHFEPWDDVGLHDAQVPIEATVLAMNQHIEAMVRRAPGQYLWGYARDKQPRNEA
jgi:KDO2-lipid IV(A) lauroyltransferase